MCSTCIDLHSQRHGHKSTYRHKYPRESHSDCEPRAENSRFGSKVEQDHRLSQSLGTVLLVTANFNDEPLILRKATTLGIAREISENITSSMTEEKNKDARKVPFVALSENARARNLKF